MGIVKFILTAFLLQLCSLNTIKVLQGAYQQERQQIQLPDSLTKPSIEQQNDQFRRTISTPDFKDFKGNPTYNAQFALNQNRTSESLWIKGKQMDYLQLQIQVNAEHNSEQVKLDQEGVEVFLINQFQGKIPFSLYVHHFGFLKMEINSDLYELRVRLSQGTIGRKVLDIKMDINSPKSQPNSHLTQLHQHTKEIYEETQTIFLNSLENWQTIKKHKKEYISQQKMRTLSSFLELAFILVFNVVEVLLLKSQIQKKILI